MSVFNVISKVRKVLGKLTDWLIEGRKAGLWSEGHSIKKGKK